MQGINAETLTNTVLYMSYEEEKSYYILSKLQCLLMHNIPNTKAYLAAILNDFFRTKQCYSQVLDDIGKRGRRYKCCCCRYYLIEKEPVS